MKVTYCGVFLVLEGLHLLIFFFYVQLTSVKYYT